MRFAFASILIASALLLSAESHSSPPAPIKNNQSKNISPPTQSLNHEAQEDTKQAKYAAAEYRLNRLQTWFNGFLVLFTAALVGVGAWQARRLRQTVEASKETANAAWMGLQINRPFLLVTNVRVTNAFQINGGCTFHFAIDVRNFGVGPADVMTYIAEGALFERPGLSFKEPSFGYPSDIGEHPQKPLIAPHENIEGFVPVILPCKPDEYAATLEGTKWIGIHGRFLYRGAPEFIYSSRFFWWCFVRAEDDQFLYRAYSEELNAHT